MSNKLSKHSYSYKKDDYIPGTEYIIIRELDVKKGYDIHRKIGNELYGSSGDLLERNLFSNMEQYVIRKCGFPYVFKNIKDKSLKHDLIWINPKYNKYWSRDRIISQVKCSEKYKERDILKIWENVKYLRSVPKIRHYHIISILRR